MEVVTCTSVQPSKDIPHQIITDPQPVVMLANVAGSSNYSQTDSFMSVTCAQFAPAANCEENGASMADMAILVLSGK